MTWRYKFSFAIINLLFAIIVLRLFYWQIIKADDLSSLAESQYGNIVKVQPQRGEIQTSDGFPIAGNKLSYLVFANPKEIKNKTKTARTLSSYLKIDEASIGAQLSLDKFWVPVSSGVDPLTKDKISKLNLSGVGFEEDYERFYPEASMAASLLGFVGQDENGDQKGYFGLEGYYDRLLKGKQGVAIQIHDALGQPILAKVHSGGEELSGSTLVLTINREIQYLVEKELKKGIDKYQAESGMVGVMDPKTGKILAMASFPSFDPANYRDYSNDLFKNSFISDLYEPGSTFKPLVMSAALNQNLIKPDTRCNACGGPVSIGGYQIHTWNDKYTKNITMTDVIIHSDNTGMVFVSQKLGLSRMLSSLKSFGIGDLTGVDLQGETTSPLKPKDDWYVVDLATSAFGQGISVTPIELLTAFSSVANGGSVMKPHLVSEVINPNGEKVKIEPKVLSRPITTETSKVMTEIMVNAVNKGEAQFTRLKGYRIAGKTGTASIPIEGHYDPTKTIASFIGFAPADDPKFLMIVIFNRPTASIYGAETAAPVFFNIARGLLNHYHVVPTQ